MYRFYSNPQETNNIRVSVVGIHSEGVLSIAVSRCSAQDTFNRKKGRAIAEGRLAKGKIYNRYLLEHCDIKTFVNCAKEIASVVSRDTRGDECFTMQKKLSN